MSTFISTVLFAGLAHHVVAQGPGSAAVSNACSTTVYTAASTALAGSEGPIAPLAPGGLALYPIASGSNKAVRIAEQSGFDDPHLLLEVSENSGTYTYDVSDLKGNPFASQGYTLATSDPSCPAGSCAPGATGCACTDVDAGCTCASDGNSITVTVCAS